MNTKELLIQFVGSQFFTAKFVKKDGTERTMNGRLGVTKHLHGGKSTTDDKDNLLTVYDLQKEGYRCVNLETLRELRCHGRTMHF